MNEQLKAFIEQNIELIESGDFDLVYNLTKEHKYERWYVGELTDMLYAIDIHPLNYLKEVPEGFLNGSTQIKNLYIPSNIREISWYAFYISSLKSVSIPDSIKKIDNGAFFNCNDLEEIKYYGTMDQFKQIELVGDAKSGLKGRTIECTDGPLFIY